MHVVTRRFVQMLLLAAPFAVSGCRQVAPPVDKAAIEAKLRQLDADWNKASAQHSADGWVSFYTDDTVVLPPNDKMVSGLSNIHQYVAGLMGVPGLQLSWTSDKVVVDDAGDMAYLYGAYTLSMTGPKGAPINDKGKNLELWRKQADGSWKCVADTWSSDMPVPGM